MHITVRGLLSLLTLFFSTVEDEFSINPDEEVQPAGARASFSCLYKTAPNSIIQWGVIKSGTPGFVINNTNNQIISADTKTLTFNPVAQSNEGSYYCYVALSSTDERCSKLVTFTILRKSMICLCPMTFSL